MKPSKDFRMQLNNTIQKLENYSIQDWIEWIENEIYEIPNELTLPLIDVTLDEKLIVVYKKFVANPQSRKKLITASVSLILQLAFNKSSPKGLYYLILFIGYCKPEAFAAQLELLLKKEVLNKFVFNNVNLNHLLLNELINFISIENFTDYFLYSVTNGKDVNIKIIGLKYYCRSQSEEKYFMYLESLTVSEIKNTKSLDLLSSEIVESFAEFCYIRKSYCSLHKWIETFVPKLRFDSIKFYDSLCNNILYWLNDENLIIKEEKNICALKIKKLVTDLLTGEDKLPSFLNFAVIEGYTFDEFSFNSGNLPSLDTMLLEFGNEVNKRTKDDSQISNMLAAVQAQLTYRGIRNPEELRNMAREVLNN